MDEEIKERKREVGRFERMCTMSHVIKLGRSTLHPIDPAFLRAHVHFTVTIIRLVNIFCPMSYCYGSLSTSCKILVPAMSRIFII